MFQNLLCSALQGIQKKIRTIKKGKMPKDHHHHHHHHNVKWKIILSNLDLELSSLSNLDDFFLNIQH